MRTIAFLLLSMITLSAMSQTGFIPGEAKLAYWELEGKSEVVIVLHGGPGVEHSYLRPEFDRLKEVAKVIYYDQRGCGKSDQGRLSYYYWDHMADLERVIKHHAKGKKVFIASSSWGSLLALMYAYNHPEDIKGLILSGLVDWRGREWPQLKTYKSDYLDKHPDYKGPKVGFIQMEENRIRREVTASGEESEYKEEIVKQVTHYYGYSTDQAMASLQTGPKIDSLASIKIPTLIYNGTQPCNYFRAVNEYAEIIPNSVLIHIKGSCHDPWFSNPEAFFRIANQFVKNRKRTLRKLKREGKIVKRG
ncbi:MAG: alpha/beta fold hydrolase [Bacteroidia bacterium]|nr:alpha/beta fold hydrolase [Bacteroidia bacterium]